MKQKLFQTSLKKNRHIHADRHYWGASIANKTRYFYLQDMTSHASNNLSRRAELNLLPYMLKLFLMFVVIFEY